MLECLVKITAELADCVNSSLPPDFPEISGNWWNLGEFGEILENSGNFSGIQWGFCMALKKNSVGIPGDFGAAPAFSRKSGNGAVRGNLGSRKAFAQTDRLDSLHLTPFRREGQGRRTKRRRGIQRRESETANQVGQSCVKACSSCGAHASL